MIGEIARGVTIRSLLARSLRFDPGLANDARRAGNLGGDQVGELPRRIRFRDDAEVAEPLLDVGQRERLAAASFSFATVSAGALAGASDPNRISTRMPGSTGSTVGTPGGNTEASAVETASSRLFPSRMIAAEEAVISGLIPPAAIAFVVGASPRDVQH